MRSSISQTVTDATPSVTVCEKGPQKAGQVLAGRAAGTGEGLPGPAKTFPGLSRTLSGLCDDFSRSIVAPRATGWQSVCPYPQPDVGDVCVCVCVRERERESPMSPANF